jgi:hypothetical protein
VAPSTPPATTPAIEVKGEQATQIKHKHHTPVVKGQQAQLPTVVDAGLAGDVSQASSSSSQLWLAGMTGLLAAAMGLGLLSSRRLRGRA